MNNPAHKYNESLPPNHYIQYLVKGDLEVHSSFLPLLLGVAISQLLRQHSPFFGHIDCVYLTKFITSPIFNLACLFTQFP